MILNEYQKVSGHSIEQAIVAEFRLAFGGKSICKSIHFPICSGDIKDGLLAIVKSIRNRPAFFAELLYNSMRGIGTRDTDLVGLQCEEVR